MSTIRTQVVRIGNSRGVRIPKVLIDQLGLGTDVEISVEDDHLVIRAASRARRGWDEQFRAMAEHGDDQFLDEPASTDWDTSEWTW